MADSDSSFDDTAVPGRVLVINVTRIGDTLLVTPAIRAIASAWPQARITVMGHPKRVEIIENLPYVREVATITKKTAPWKDRLRARHWDLAVVFGFDKALVRYALRVADRVICWEQDDPLLNRRVSRTVVKPKTETLSAVDMLNVLPCEGLGIAAAGKVLDYVATAEEIDWARTRLAGIWPNRPDPLVGLVLESFPTKPYRDWPLESFVELCARILQRHPGAGFVLLGGDHSREKLEGFRQRFADRVAVMAGTLSLRQSAAIMTQLDLYVGCDTGPTHIAGALKTVPMVVLYHCLHRSWVLAPQGHAALSVIDHPASDDQCGPESTMADIPVEAVYDQVERRLGKRAAG